MSASDNELKFIESLRQTLGASEIVEQEQVQALWSGYGSIKRYQLSGADIRSVIVKHVSTPEVSSHPRGWGTELSHSRKIRSYAVELAWYKSLSKLCAENCRVASCYASSQEGDEFFLALEDLDAQGFSERRSELSIAEVEVCLDWLASFHATYLEQEPVELWPIGTYWHLETRPDELESMKNEALKNAAALIDRRLNESKFQTLVHGDAKLANFCFSEGAVAAVDFQYIGGGCGMKDVAYFLGSCLSAEDCERYEQRLLARYFSTLSSVLVENDKVLSFEDLRLDWMNLYPFAWADFQRFLEGWNPGHWKLNDYSERQTRKVLACLS